MDSWITKHIALRGGLITVMPQVEQGIAFPGSCIVGKNFEPAQDGGYRRLSGFTKFSTTAVTGTGALLGCFVFNGGVLAMRGTGVYTGSGTTWTSRETAARTGAKKYDATIYNWVGDTIAFVDDTNPAAKWDGTTYTLLNGTGAPTAPKWVQAHQTHLFLAQGPNLTISAPNDDTDYSAANGAAIINVGSDITGLGTWREVLYVFSKNRIQKITGTGKVNWALKPVTEEIGCVNGGTIQEVGGDLLFLGPDGIRPVAGTDKIGDVEIGSLSMAIKPLVNNLGPTFESGSMSSVVVREKSQYRLWGSKSADPEETAFGILGGLREVAGGSEGAASASWEWFELEGIKVACSHSDYITGVETVIHGDYDGFVFKQEFGASFDGENVLANFQIPYITYDDPKLRKVLHKLDAFVDAEGENNVRINIVLDYDDPDVIQPPEIQIITTESSQSIYDDPGTVYDTAIYDTPTKVSREHGLVGGCFNHSIIVSSNDTNPAYTLKEFLIEYSLKGRR